MEKGEAEFVQRLIDLGVRGDILNPITGLPLFISQHKINFIFVFFYFFFGGSVRNFSLRPLALFFLSFFKHGSFP